MTDSLWFVRFRPVTSPELRWYTFAHAGGAASAFRPLTMALPPTVEVCAIQAPGRWNRAKEPPTRRVHEQVEALWSTFVASLDGAPFALWGHSLGALVAFELARKLQREGKPAPRLLLASARRAPTLLPLGEPVSHLPDPAFVDAIDARYGGISPVIRSDPEMLALTLPALRADMEMYETYRCDPGPPLSCPITVLYGANDPITSADTIEPWRAQTSATFTATTRPGGHFFPFDAGNRADMIERLSRA